MKIVTYNVNGLRPRITQFGSLLKLLDSFDADIICFQETKLRRQELKADVVMAIGYESFFSCTRTCQKGRTAYSGVATFCRVKSAFSSSEVALPVVAEEGFTGLLVNSKTRKGEMLAVAEGLEEFAKDELLKIDSEGRCIITDHGHFVLFNIYGPRAESNDTERIQFKFNFYQMLQKRWESLVNQGRRVTVVGDLNIAPTSMDRCDAGPDFENNEFRKWFRSLLVESGGQFLDVFRTKHPDRKDAYTCWSQSTGAEVFNYGSRIDHILCVGSCLHQDHNVQGHNFITCHVMECDILTQYKRWKHGDTYRWKGERTTKLEGSDHAPVYMTLGEIPDISQHNTPSLSARYIPMIHGVQQTLVSLLTKRQATDERISHELSSSLEHGNITIESCSQRVNRSSDNFSISGTPPGESCSISIQESEALILETEENLRNLPKETKYSASVTSGNEHIKPMLGDDRRKKVRKSQCVQISLKSFFQKSSNLRNDVENCDSETSVSQPTDVSRPNQYSTETLGVDVGDSVSEQIMSSSQGKDEVHASLMGKEKSNVALMEWRRIQKVMQDSIPLCKGHNEPCIARVVKKQGPNFGRRFYVCARAEGPASNSDANCGYFKWAASKSQQK